MMSEIKIPANSASGKGWFCILLPAESLLGQRGKVPLCGSYIKEVIPFLECAASSASRLQRPPCYYTIPLRDRNSMYELRDVFQTYFFPDFHQEHLGYSTCPSTSSAI